MHGSVHWSLCICYGAVRTMWVIRGQVLRMVLHVLWIPRTGSAFTQRLSPVTREIRTSPIGRWNSSYVHCYHCYHCYHSRLLPCCCSDTCRHPGEWSEDSSDRFPPRSCTRTALSRGDVNFSGARGNKGCNLACSLFIPAAHCWWSQGYCTNNGGSRPSAFPIWVCNLDWLLQTI